jgi:hypothetical protein
MIGDQRTYNVQCKDASPSFSQFFRTGYPETRTPRNQSTSVK